MPSNASDISPQYALLGFLYLKPMHGYDLHKALDSNLCEVWRISQSQAYNILSRLQREGLVQASIQPQEKHPDRQMMKLTESGKSLFENWLFTPTRSSARALRVEFLTRLFFASQIGDDICSQILQNQAEVTEQDIQSLTDRFESIPSVQILNRLGLELRIRQLSVIHEWLTSCEADLFSPYLPSP